MTQLLMIGLCIPLLGFALLFLFSEILTRKSIHRLACGTILISFLCFSYLFYLYQSLELQGVSFSFFEWLPVQGIQADFKLHLDALSLLMTLIITGVGFLIHLYSIGYMSHEEDYARYFACLNFFVFSMLLLVLAGNLLLLFVGWEGVGLASYLLIGFWYEKTSAANAAKKAFIVNRIGDFGFLVGLLLTFYLFGTSDIASVIQMSQFDMPVGLPVVTLLTLLLFMGATGKSAQLPLHVWLPDAMEGPTPVSALIHAATMVTAGVYLIVRLYPLFILAPITLVIIGGIGAATALFAALCALGQTDLKKVLAYSTVSQLGYMFLACGVGAFYGAMFHLTMHAFIKALLFLAAGNVIHRMHDETQMGKMGGLKKVFPRTHWLFLIGVLALSGIPPLAAFFSKDLILEEAYLSGYKTLFYVGVITAALTAFYLTRAYCLTFMGSLKQENASLREAPKVMIWPVTLLALLSLFGGLLGVSFASKPSLLEGLLAKVGLGSLEGEHSYYASGLSIFSALAGVIVATWVYTQYRERLTGPLKMLQDAFYMDELYDRLIVCPLGYLARLLGATVEPKIFDKGINVAARSTVSTASLLQKMQSGQLRSYVAWLAIGAAFLMAYFIL